MRWWIAAMLLAAGAAGADDKALTEAADLVVTGHVIGTGFAHTEMFDNGQSEFAAVEVEKIEKGVPVKPLKLLLDDDLQDLECCASGLHYKMYLKREPNGFYSAVDGHNGIVRLD